MLISRKLLNQWIDVSKHSIETISDKLSLAGLEVEGTETFALDARVVLARVLHVEKHPDAKKLSVLQVSTGENTEQIVCGAANVFEGALVALAQPGAVLPGEMTIAHAEIRGVKSAGMLASEKELGLSENHEGIMIVAEEHSGRLGQSIATLLSLNDTILEIGVTPDRSDALSHFGIARELSALLEQDMLQDGYEVEELAWVDAPPSLKIHASDLCQGYRLVSFPNYCSSKLADKASCDSRLLGRVGFRSKASAVDATNLCLVNIGQPTHAFDAAKLRKRAGSEGVSIEVRCAQEGEKIKTLDEVEVVLSSEDLVIADRKGPIAIAGVMGGLETAVDENTTEVWFEVAHFAADSVRASSRRHGIHSESSYRYERGVDPLLHERAIRELAKACNASQAHILGEQGLIEEAVSLNFMHSELEALVGGTSLDSIRVVKRLQNLGIKTRCEKGEYHIDPPTHRPDLTRSVDVMAEWVRTEGFDSIVGVKPRPAKPPRLGSRRTTRKHLAKVTQARGFREHVNLAFMSHAEAELVASSDEYVCIANPLGVETALMRSSLQLGLLKNAAAQMAHSGHTLRCYEMGTIFTSKHSENSPNPRQAGSALGADSYAKEHEIFSALEISPSGKDKLETIRGALAKVKLVVEEVFDFETSLLFEQNQDFGRLWHPSQSASLVCEGHKLGVFGVIHPRVLAFYGLEKYSAVAFDIDVEKLAELRSQIRRTYKAFSKFPGVTRDISVGVPESTRVSALREILREAGQGSALESIDVFDIYRGDTIEAGQKAVAMRLTFQSHAGTLKDEDVDPIVASALALLESKLGATQR